LIVGEERSCCDNAALAMSVHGKASVVKTNVEAPKANSCVSSHLIWIILSLFPNRCKICDFVFFYTVIDYNRHVFVLLVDVL